MSIEEEVYFQKELFGEFPVIPQWEAVADRVILEEHLPQTSEVSSVYHQSKFQEDFEEGFI